MQKFVGALVAHATVVRGSRTATGKHRCVSEFHANPASQLLANCVVAQDAVTRFVERDATQGDTRRQGCWFASEAGAPSLHAQKRAIWCPPGRPVPHQVLEQRRAQHRSFPLADAQKAPCILAVIEQLAIAAWRAQQRDAGEELLRRLEEIVDHDPLFHLMLGLGKKGVSEIIVLQKQAVLEAKGDMESDAAKKLADHFNR